MRQAHNNVEKISDKNIFYGISLGYDYCAEHEWGIDGLIKKLGLDYSKMGLDARMISKHDTVKLFIKDNFTLLTTRPCSSSDELEDALPFDIKHVVKYKSNEKTLYTAWSEKDFAILTTDTVGHDQLTEIYDAFQKNDIALARLNGGAFSGTSLSVLIASKLPKEVTDELYLVDKAKNDLIEYEAQIGITKLKEEAQTVGYKGIHYFMACSAKWIDYHNEANREKLKTAENTKYDVQYWVNYSDNDDNYGWYTAEEIIKWLSTPGLKLTEIRKGK